MAEAGGNSGTAANVANNVTGVTTGRMGFNGGKHGGHKGGHGVGLLQEDSGAAIWAQYVHGKDDVKEEYTLAKALLPRAFAIKVCASANN